MGRIIDRRRVMGGKSLPYDAEIEYLQSSGTQEIDTLIKPNENIGVRCEVTRLEYHSGNDIFLGCSEKGTYNGGRGFAIDFVQYFYMINYVGIGLQVQLNHKYIVSMNYNNDNKGRYDDTVVSLANKSGTYTEKTIRLFNFNFSGEGVSRHSQYASTRVRFHCASFTRNNAVILDLIPVRIGTTGYMYDKVSGQLFGNSGTGNFILGPDK